MDDLSFKQWLLKEMPITNFQTLGKWGPDDRPRGYNKQDIGILTNPKAVEKVHRQWSNSKENFDLYFIRQPNAAKFIETGEVTPEWVKEKLSLDIHPVGDHITVIFTNNKGAEKIPMTAWTMAHRLGHALTRTNGLGNNKTMYNKEFVTEVEKDFKNIVRQMFPKQIQQPSGWTPYNDQKPNPYTVQPLHIAYIVGSMKSARERNLRNFFEFSHELTAQYLITGKVKFNPLTKSVLLRNRMAWGNPAPQTRYSGASDEELEELNEELQNMAEKYEYTLDGIFQSLLGKMFVM